MKVYLCYECTYDYCDIRKYVEKVVDTELKAYEWQEDKVATEFEWREYVMVEVE